MLPSSSSSISDLFFWATSFTLVVTLMLANVLIHRRPAGKILRVTLVIVLAIQILSFGAYALYQFLFYEQSPTGKFFLPPYSVFFLRQIGAGMSSIVSGWISAAVLFSLLCYFILHKKNEAFVDKNDIMMIVIGATAVGWPAVFVFLALAFILSVLAMLALVVFKKKTLTDRLTITPYIIPAAILTLVFGQYLLNVTHLNVIRF